VAGIVLIAAIVSDLAGKRLVLDKGPGFVKSAGGLLVVVGILIGDGRHRRSGIPTVIDTCTTASCK
jgi:hypothetical protein